MPTLIAALALGLLGWVVLILIVVLVVYVLTRIL